MLLYYITDRRGFAGTEAEQRTGLLRCIGEAARAGVDYIQLREKDLDPADLELLAHQAVRAIRDSSATAKLLINTHVEIALAVGADGVHLPAGSPPAATIRRQWLQNSASEPVIGVSTHNISDAQQAEVHGANFAVLAPIFEKVETGASGIGLDVLHGACALTGMPVLALGGVKLGNARTCLEAGAAGVAGIRLFQENGVGGTVEALRWLSRQVWRSAG
ncbi:MAG TPA: thiamine phosphate synthase [Candidatus Angelobacter sp.]|jgi:thiamine-phosphate pyrophosphorylase|nr:thiamine phosphate synthase [Candidatus Angelobacter sp.]